MVLFDGQDIFGRAHAVFLKPLGFDIETAGRLVHDFHIKLLALFREQPIDENPRGVGMGRVLDHSDNAGAIARRQSFFYLRQFAPQSQEIISYKPRYGGIERRRASGKLIRWIPGAGQIGSAAAKATVSLLLVREKKTELRGISGREPACVSVVVIDARATVPSTRAICRRSKPLARFVHLPSCNRRRWTLWSTQW